MTWAGGPTDYLLQELITDSEGKEVAMRFGGNLSILKEQANRGGLGIVACFLSCLEAVIGNAEYSFRDFANRIRLYSIQNSRWKLIYDSIKSQFELYDLKEDPQEENDVSGKNSKIVLDLSQRLFQHLRKSKPENRP